MAIHPIREREAGVVSSNSWTLELHSQCSIQESPSVEVITIREVDYYIASGRLPARGIPSKRLAPRVSLYPWHGIDAFPAGVICWTPHVVGRGMSVKWILPTVAVSVSIFRSQDHMVQSYISVRNSDSSIDSWTIPSDRLGLIYRFLLSYLKISHQRGLISDSDHVEYSYYHI